MTHPRPLTANRHLPRVSVHIWCMEMTCSSRGSPSGVLGILGYQAIREAATTMARTEANRVVARQMKRLRAAVLGGMPNGADEEPKPAAEEETE